MMVCLEQLQPTTMPNADGKVFIKSTILIADAMASLNYKSRACGAVFPIPNRSYRETMHGGDHMKMVTKGPRPAVSALAPSFLCAGAPCSSPWLCDAAVCQRADSAATPSRHRGQLRLKGIIDRAHESGQSAGGFKGAAGALSVHT